MDSHRDDAIENYVASMPTVDTFVPAMIDACNLGARREALVEVIARGPLMSVFETTHRQALVALSAEEIEEITALFATQPSSLVTALLKWASGFAWAATEVKAYVDAEYDRLLSQEDPR